MCMEDIRIGRKIIYRTTVVAVPIAAATTIVSANSKRVFLALSVAGANNCLAAPKGVDTTAGFGFTLQPTVYPLHLAIDRWGQAVTDQWQGTALVGTANVLAIEGFLEVE